MLVLHEQHVRAQKRLTEKALGGTDTAIDNDGHQSLESIDSDQNLISVGPYMANANSTMPANVSIAPRWLDSIPPQWLFSAKQPNGILLKRTRCFELLSYLATRESAKQISNGKHSSTLDSTTKGLPEKNVGSGHARMPDQIMDLFREADMPKLAHQWQALR
jgi:hypothetical protein